MKQFLLKWSMALAMLLPMIPMYGYDFVANGIFYRITSTERAECEVVSGDQKYEGEISILPTVTADSKTYNVTGIGEGAFKDCWGVNSVRLPGSLTEIKSEAFKNCTGLTFIDIPDNVQSVDKNAFNGSNLRGLYIGKAINKIGTRAFSQVTEIHMTSSLTEIGVDDFEYAEELQQLYVTPSLQEVEKNAFAFCGNLQGVYVEDLASWCGIKFGNEYSNPTSKSGNLYLNDNFITSLAIPDGVASIGNFAFYGCKYIYDLRIPNSVETIGEYVFYECNRLSTLYLGKGLKSIGTWAFRGNLIMSIYVDDIDAFCQIDTECYLFNQVHQTSLFHDNKLVTRIDLKEGVEKIGNRIFEYYDKLSSVAMPNSVKEIGDCAFAYCTGLIKVSLSESLKVIPYGCFDCTPNLTKINIPKELEEIGDYAFSSSGVEEIILPNSVRVLGEYAFDWCYAQKISLSNKIETLKRGIFWNCENLTDLNLGNGIKEMDSCIAFCPKIESIALPSSLIKIVWNFNECPNLKTIYCNAPTPPQEAFFPEDLLQRATLYVPVGSKEKYLEAYGWNGFYNIVELDGLGAVDGVSINSPSEISRVNLQGVAVDEDYEGLVIITYSDGSVRKVMINR